MCLIVQPIVARSEYRFVAQCEHGTVFVHWQISCWTLAITDFNNLVAFLETTKNNLETEVKDGAHALKRAYSGVQLWVVGYYRMLSAISRLYRCTNSFNLATCKSQHFEKLKVLRTNCPKRCLKVLFHRST